VCLLFCCFVQQPHTATPHALYSAPHPLFVSFRPPHTLHPLRCRALPLAASWGTTLRPILKYLCMPSALVRCWGEPFSKLYVALGVRLLPLPLVPSLVPSLTTRALLWARFCVSGAVLRRPVNQVVTRWHGALQNSICRQASMQISGPFRGCCQQGDLLGGEGHLVA